jgi:hypothetical protein
MFTPPPFSYSTTYHGIKIIGTVLWCNVSDAEIEITSPYSGIRAGLHTALWVNSPKIRNLDGNGKISERGYRTIESCLIIAYEEADFLFQNKEVLHERIVGFESELKEFKEKLKDLNDNFPNEKKVKKQLPQMEYRKYLKDYQEEIGAMGKRINKIYDSLYSGFPEYRTRYEDENQDIEFIKKYFARENYRSN